MNIDLSKFEEMDRTTLLEVNGGYYGTQNIYVPDSYVYKNANDHYRRSVDNGTRSKGSIYGYSSAGGGRASDTPVTPTGYLIPTAGGDGHYYTDGNGDRINADGSAYNDYNLDDDGFLRDGDGKLVDPTGKPIEEGDAAKVVILADHDGVMMGLGHTSGLIIHPNGHVQYFSKEGPDGDASSEWLENSEGYENGNIKLEGTMEYVLEKLSEQGRMQVSEGLGDGSRFESAIVMNVSSADAGKMVEHLEENWATDYSLAGNHCGNLWANALEEGIGYDDDLLWPSQYNTTLSNNDATKVIDIETDLNYDGLKNL